MTAGKKAPGELASKTGRQTDYRRLYRFLRAIQRPGWAFCWAIERLCSKIETASELAKWNRENRK